MKRADTHADRFEGVRFDKDEHESENCPKCGQHKGYALSYDSEYADLSSLNGQMIIMDEWIGLTCLCCGYERRYDPISSFAEMIPEGDHTAPEEEEGQILDALKEAVREELRRLVDAGELAAPASGRRRASRPRKATAEDAEA